MLTGAPFSEPRTSILGTKELFIESGSTINLTCVIHTGGQAMDGKHIFWNYDGKVTQSLLPLIATRTTGESPPSLPQIITHDRNRVGTIMINRRFRDIVTSLIITRAQPSDSGTYACDPASPFSKSIRVVVTTGECTKKEGMVGEGGRFSRQDGNGCPHFLGRHWSKVSDILVA